MKEKEFNDIYTQAESVMERWYKGDPFGWLDNMAEEMTYLSPFEKHRIDGKSTIVALMSPIEGQIHSPGFEMLDPDLHLGTDMAVFTYHLNELDEEGVQTYGWKVTEAYRRMDGKWKMIHAHFSTNVEGDN